MGKSLLVILLFSLTATANAQVEPVRVQEEYCVARIWSPVLSRQVEMSVDFGEERRRLRDNILEDSVTGKRKRFNSVADALNHMAAGGWVLVNAVPVYSQKSTDLHYIFRRKVNMRDAALVEERRAGTVLP